jgi:hypothetical protein
VSNDIRYIVQFPHPGPERMPKPSEVGAQLPWNTGDHGRKFLWALGKWTDGTTAGNGDLAFWGEWEAQSRVAALLERGPGLPRVLQQPYWQVPDSGAWRQNTDPLVFGEQFIWSNCRQQQNAKLRQVGPGSLVLFGSKVLGRFALDTMFVVAGSSSYRPIDGLADGGALDPLVIEPLALSDKDAGTTFRLYRGATPAAPVDGIFSFAPCMPFDGEHLGFARPILDLGDLLNHNLTQNARCTPATVETAGAVWRSVVEQVLAAGLMLGTSFLIPDQQ